MSTPSENSGKIFVVLSYDRAEMARRGRLGGLTTHARHDPKETTRAGRESFLSRFTTNEERTAYFSRLARLSAEARRKRASEKEVA